LENRLKSGNAINDFVFQDKRLEEYKDIHCSVTLDDHGHSLKLNRPPIFSLNMKLLSGFPVDHKGRIYFLLKEMRGGLLPHENVRAGYIHQAGSVIAAPLYNGENIVGTLCLATPYLGYFEERHLRPVQLLATLLAYSLSYHPKNKTPASIELGQVLKEVRQDLGITQETLSERLGQSRITVSHWESGAQPPSQRLLCQWCNALNLLSPPNKSLISLVDISPQLLELLREDPQKLRELTPSQFEQFVAESLIGWVSM
jgi:transcriptional regulator with XRE-family HTH domain